jgi:copper chaperone
MVTQTFDVIGMTCEHCVGAVRGEIEQLPGVRAVDVDLTAGRVAITSDDAVDDDAVRKAVDEAGYEVAS